MSAVSEQILGKCPEERVVLSDLPVHRKELSEIIFLSRLGDQSAFTELIRRIQIPVRALALRMTRNPDDAADIAQLTYLKIWGNLHAYDFDKPFMTWLYRITVNTTIDYQRTNKRHKHGALDDLEESSAHFQREETHLPDRIRFRKQITEASTRLKPKQKRALYLRDIVGNSIEDMTAELKIPEPTARWHLHQARIMMRKELRRRCPELLSAFGIK